jgi:hypothetical protein
MEPQIQFLMRTGQVMALLAVLLIIGINIAGSALRKVEGVGQPGIALQVSTDPAVIAKLLATQDLRYAAAAAQYVDFYFIPCYVAVFVLGGLLQFRLMPAPWNWFGLAAALLVVAAGVCDAAENTGILRAIAAADGGWSMPSGLVAFWSWRKWTLVLAATVALAPITFHLPGWRWAGFVLAGVAIAGGLGGLAACYTQNQAWLERTSLATGAPAWVFLGPLVSRIWQAFR